MKKFAILMGVCLLLLGQADGQPINRDILGEKVGRFVDSLGPMAGSPLKDVVDSFKARKFNETEMAYGIYSWIAKNVSFNTKAYHHPGASNNSASGALNTRSVSGEGFANLFKAMCDLARIQSVVIDGTAKTHPYSIGDISKAQRHSWNAVNIRNTWYYVDAAFGAGYTDRKVKYFTTEFTDVWFFTNRSQFLISHFPNDKKWQFADEQINKSQFLQAPVVSPVAIKTEVFYQDGTRGRLKGKKGDCKRVVFELKKPADISRVGVEINELNTAADYYIDGNQLFVDVPFPRTGKYPIIVTLNGKKAYGFLAEVVKKPRRY
ncbi:MAG: hypothetical protein EOO04_35145 [Chitinophagaceae bacterium]|nr:MAG: hypothetical protein EOO04_35145 [Chitinophagaceae bacterium]